MEQTDFLDFANLLKTYLVLRKKHEKGKKIIWNDCQWLKYDSNFGRIAYKKSLIEEENFDYLSLRHQVKQFRMENLTVVQAYNKLLPISSEKKKNVLDLLPLIPPVYYSFYKDLRCTDQEDIDPDLIDNTE